MDLNSAFYKVMSTTSNTYFCEGLEWGVSRRKRVDWLVSQLGVVVHTDMGNWQLDPKVAQTFLVKPKMPKHEHQTTNPECL